MSQNLPEFVIRNIEDAGINNPQIRALVAAHANPIVLSYALIGLKNADILTPEIQALVAAKDMPSMLANALVELKNADILTPEIQALVAAKDIPGMLANALVELKKADILTPETQALVAAKDIPGMLANALVELKKADILTPETQALVAAKDIPGMLANALVELKNAVFLEPENIAMITGHQNPIIAVEMLNKLNHVGLLNQQNFNALLAPNHIACVSQEALQAVNLIPPHLWTQDNFQRLITASEAPNPQQALQAAFNQILGIGQVVAPQQAFNQVQSTHTASVHASVSKSAGKLMEGYVGLIEGSKLDSVIGEIGAYVNSLGNSHKNQAAKRAFERLTEPQYTFTDSSGVSTRQLLALAWLAIKDDSKRAGDLQDAQASFIEGLYEIQRGYNINESGVDNEAIDLSICSAGTFNKIIEKLTGIHQDVELKFVTKEGAASKFIPLALHHTLQCLKEIASQNSAEAAQLITDLKEAETLAPIWGMIKDKVQSELWEEFKEAYGNNPENSKFKELIDCGVEIGVPDAAELDNILQPSQAKLGMFGHAQDDGEKNEEPSPSPKKPE